MQSLRPSSALSAAPARRADHGVGNVHAGDVSADPFGRLGGAQRSYADQDEHVVQQAEVLDLAHEGPQQRHVVAELCLDELRAGGDFFCQALRAPLDGVRERILRRPEQHPRSAADLAAGKEMMLVAQRARGLQQCHGIEIEHRQRLRVITGLDAIAREAQQVAHAHRGAAEDVALDGDAVAVAAGNLHDRCIADPGEQRAHRQARHVAVGAAAVGRVDGVHVAVKDARAAVDLFRIGGVGWREFARDHELSGAQHALEAPGRGMPGQDRQRIARDRFVLEDHGVSPARSRTTRSQEDLPCRRRSTAACTCA